ncbi:ribonucleoside-triphosphate reductase, adenosylcobalamin-dependent [Deinococcus sp. S9]|uniref:ribonucleoside-triphosphate reductase, adenosylcobalamin-dependent n=1 Tax=Deinococcus sp. S9 TaxID=2545754 RepID=UPI0014052FEC|nr:ribonucleoside-triphosphate reductase, adenosylcobalamin-dependent [Deinococcus sp. S9]
MSPLLSQEFIDRYSHRQPEWGPLGQVVRLRTYARWLPDKQRRETWTETVARVVEYSLSLDALTDPRQKRQEAEALFDAIWNLRALPSGRTLWVGGTEHTRRHAEANFNCSYTDLRSVDDLHDMVILLMNGVGVGFGVRPDEVAAFASQGELAVCPNVVLQPYHYVGLPGTRDATEMTVETDALGTRTHFAVGDSREGWAAFVRDFVYALLFCGKNHTITVDFDAVRPKGTPLKTFGGYASGPEALMDFVKGAVSVFRGATEIRDIHLLDLCNLIGRMVVAGGTRRSAQIALGSPSSEGYLSAKTGEWYQDFPWRSQSNNSIVFDEKPTRERLREVFASVMAFGEPGFINGASARRKRADWRGGNPCFEILLASKGFCNLVTLNLAHYASRPLDLQQLKEDARLMTRHNLRVTEVFFQGIQAAWTEHQRRDRLLGVSFTGYDDLASVIGEEVVLGALQEVREHVGEVARDYAYVLRCPEPLLKTCTKPEGTISNLPGSSSGLHAAFAPYYIRRIRISDTDAVGKALDLLGVPNEPDQFAPNTLVFEFPVATPAKRLTSDIPAVEQLTRYFNVMNAWVDHNASSTIYVAPEEVEDVIDLLMERWDEYVGVSFLPKAGGTYPQMPYEAITQEEYERRAAKMPRLDRLEEIIAEIERMGMQATDDFEGCESGTCPVR